MRRILPLLICLTFATPVAAQRQSVGIFGQWGAFREANGRCFAIAEPARPAQGPRPYASIGYWPRQNVRGQLHIRLSREKRRGSAILLRIDDRSFQLVGGGHNAWAPNAHADAEIAAAMRTGIDMVVETRSTTGGLIRDQYLLRGAATAIDAAAIACAT